MYHFFTHSEVLTGKNRNHLVALPNALSDKHFLHTEVVDAFIKLQQAAEQAGFNLQPASTYRDFERQKWIWNNKFNGLRKVHDDNGCAIDLSGLDEWQKCQAILRWSAMPGASRHHWGTEIDIYDPDLLPKGQALQLEPWEYQTGGYFQKLTNWLFANAEDYGFFFPFMDREDKQIGVEPWHISYFPLAELCEQSFSAKMLQEAWENEDIAGKECLLSHLDEIFEKFVL